MFTLAPPQCIKGQYDRQIRYYIQPTSLTGECKLNGVASDTTEGVYHQVTAAPLSYVLCNLFRCCTKPALCVAYEGVHRYTCM